MGHFTQRTPDLLSICSSTFIIHHRQPMGCGASSERLEAERKLWLSKEASSPTNVSHVATSLPSETESPDDSSRLSLASQSEEAEYAAQLRVAHGGVNLVPLPANSSRQSQDGRHLSPRRCRRLNSALLSERLESFLVDKENSRLLAAAEADTQGRARLVMQKMSDPVGYSQPLVASTHQSGLDDAASDNDPLSMSVMNSILFGAPVRLAVEADAPLEEVTDASVG